MSLAVAALLAGAAAAWLAANRTFEPYQTASAPLALLVGWSFIGSGLAACSARPNNLLGRVMVLTGFAWFASFLTDAHQSLLFTVGTAVQSVYLVGFVYLVLTFPSGRLNTRLERALIWSGSQAWQPSSRLRRCCSQIRTQFSARPVPPTRFQVARDDGLANALAEAERIGGLSIVLVALTLITARWGRASALQRRSVAPVVWAGGVTLAALVVSVANDALGHPLGEVPKQMLFAALATLPVGMVLVLLQRRLARAAVAGLVVELGEREVASDLRQALARALGDASLEVAYWFPAGGRYVDSEGRPVQLPPPESGRMTTVVERGGRPVAALLHDPALEENTELIDSVCAAAALTLENERLAGRAARAAGGATGLARPPGRCDRDRAQKDRARPS